VIGLQVGDDHRILGIGGEPPASGDVTHGRSRESQRLRQGNEHLLGRANAPFILLADDGPRHRDADD